jgi:hypothetical protein
MLLAILFMFSICSGAQPINQDFMTVLLKILAASSEESSIPNKEFFVYAR